MIRFRWKPIGRFNGLPALGQSGQLIINENERRRALQLYNVGSGIVYISDEPTPLNAGQPNVFPLRAGDAFGVGTAPFAPQNALYAVGDTGHDLYVSDIQES